MVIASNCSVNQTNPLTGLLITIEHAHRQLAQGGVGAGVTLSQTLTGIQTVVKHAGGLQGQALKRHQGLKALQITGIHRPNKGRAEIKRRLRAQGRIE